MTHLTQKIPFEALKRRETGGSREERNCRRNNGLRKLRCPIDLARKAGRKEGKGRWTREGEKMDWGGRRGGELEGGREGRRKE